MAVSIASQSPAFATTKKAARVTLTLNGGGNFFRIWVTNAPLGSALKTKLQQGSLSRLEVFSGSPADIWEFEADKAGAYVFTAQEYTRGGVTFGGGFKGDPDGFSSEVKVGVEGALTLRFGQRLTMPIGFGQDRATLVLWVWDATIKPTTFDLHGETSPAIQGATTSRAITAASSTGVTTALTALENVTATTALGTLTTVLNEMIDDYNAHRVQGSVHSANDTNNVIASSFKGANSEAALKRSAAEIIQKLDRHMRNDNAGAGTGSAAYHSTADGTNALLTGPPGSLAETIGALADVWRVYEAHRASGTPIHSAADSTNTLAALPKLLDVHRQFLAMTQPLAPSPPETANAGAVTLQHGAGMSEG